MMRIRFLLVLRSGSDLIQSGSSLKIHKTFFLSIFLCQIYKNVRSTQIFLHFRTICFIESEKLRTVFLYGRIQIRGFFRGQDPDPVLNSTRIRNPVVKRKICDGRSFDVNFIEPHQTPCGDRNLKLSQFREFESALSFRFLP